MASAVSAGPCGAELLFWFYLTPWSISTVKHARFVALETGLVTGISTQNIELVHVGVIHFTAPAHLESQPGMDPSQRGPSLLASAHRENDASYTC